MNDQEPPLQQRRTESVQANKSLLYNCPAGAERELDWTVEPLAEKKRSREEKDVELSSVN